MNHLRVNKLTSTRKCPNNIYFMIFKMEREKENHQVIILIHPQKWDGPKMSA